MTECPDRDSLQIFLNGKYNDQKFRLIEGHVSTCESCQQQLDDLLSDSAGGDELQVKRASDLRPDCNSVTSLPKEVANRMVGRLVRQGTPRGKSEVPDESRSLRFDTQLGEYQIVREIGRGGMGIVYEAIQTSLGRHVALKVLPTGFFQNEDSKARFQREASAAASLHHTNIVPVFEAAQVGDTIFYTMQLIDGVGLNVVRDNMRKSKLQIQRSTVAVANAETKGSKIAVSVETSVDKESSERRSQPRDRVTNSPQSHYEFVADVGKQTASALHHAHERGVIHRDVKPSNLILDNNGMVWLADFGLAKHLDDDLTASAAAPGTMRYMSPERFSGYVDARADVYSLGASLYEILTLEPAFDSTDQLSLLEQIKNVEPTSPRNFDKNVPLDLQTIIAKAMAKEPMDRYPTAKAMEGDLVRYLEGQPILARRISPFERLWRWSKKHRAFSFSLLSLLLLIVITAVGSSVAAFYFKDLAEANSQLAADKIAESTKARQQQEEAEQNAYFADIRQAHQDLENGQMQRMLTTLRSFMPLDSSPDLRGWEWYYLLSQAHQDKATMLDFEGIVKQLAWSNDNQKLYSRGSDETLRIWDRDGKLIRKISLPGLTYFSLNPEGTQVATASGDSVLRIFETSSGKLIRTVRFDVPLQAVDWSKQGDRLALLFNTPVEALKVMDVETEAIVWAANDRFHGPIQTFAFSPDGAFVLTGWLGHKTSIYKIGEPKYVSNVSGSPDSETNHYIWSFQTMCAAWHPDGKRFAVGTYLQGVYVFEIPEELGRPKLLKQFEKSNSMDAVAFSADGKKLICGNRQQTIEVFDLESGSEKKIYNGHVAEILGVAIAKDGKMIASAANDGAIKLWETVKDASTPSRSNNSNPVNGVSPDGRWAWQIDDSAVSIFERSSGKQVAHLAHLKSNEPIKILFYPKSETAAVIRKDSYGYLRITIWDSQTWTLKASFVKSGHEGHAGIGIAGDFIVVVTGFGEMSCFNGITGETTVFQAHVGKNATAISPDGKMFATCSQGEVKLWDSNSCTELANFYGHRVNGFMPRIAWGHTGRYFATSSVDQTVRIWDVIEKKPFKTLTGLQSTPYRDGFGFSYDDSRFLARDSNSIKIWDNHTGRELISSSGSETSVKQLLKNFQSDIRDIESKFSSDELQFLALQKAESLRKNRIAVERFEHQSQYSLARELLAREELSERTIERAWALSKRALELAPADPDYLLTYSIAAWYAREYDEARRSLKLAEDSGVSSVVTEFVRAACQLEKGQTAIATKTFREASEDLGKFELVEFEISVITSVSRKFIESESAEDSIRPDKIRVTTLADELNGISDGQVSLREAVELIAKDGVIEFDVVGEIELKLGEIRIKQSLQIVGPGSDQLTINGAKKFRIFVINDEDEGRESHVLISGLKLTQGKCQNMYRDIFCGGAICTFESLTVSNVSFIDNDGGHSGGGVYAFKGKKCVVRNCKFIGNRAKTAPAIQMHKFYESMTIDSCLFDSNFAKEHSCSAVRTGAAEAELVVVNSSFTSNSSKMRDSWAIVIDSSNCKIDHCTIVDNQTGGIMCNYYVHNKRPDWPLNLSVTNCIVYGNSNSEKTVGDIKASDGVSATISNSIIGGGLGGFQDGGENQIGIDPMLKPLADNGGPTRTFALRKGSPAIDKGLLQTGELRGKAPEFDQRGSPYSRAFNEIPDIGAFEFQSEK